MSDYMCLPLEPQKAPWMAGWQNICIVWPLQYYSSQCELLYVHYSNLYLCICRVALTLFDFIFKYYNHILLIHSFCSALKERCHFWLQLPISLWIIIQSEHTVSNRIICLNMNFTLRRWQDNLFYINGEKDRAQTGYQLGN